MAKATETTETTEPAVEVPATKVAATKVAAGNVRRTALRTFLDSATGKMVDEGALYETTEQRARELAQMGCLKLDS